MKVLGYSLDNEQLNIVKDDNKFLLVIAGAGSGKSLTILGKIKYLVEVNKVLPEEIICITFTNNAAISLQEKLNKENLNVKSYTFHKLAMEIINNKNYLITEEETLSNIVYQFFNVKLLDNEEYMYLVLNYFNKFTLFNIKKKYLELLKDNNKEMNILSKNIISFIRNFKTYNYNIKDFTNFLKEIKHTINYFKYRKEKIFLILCLNIYIEYETYLKEANELDFDDLITIATQSINGYNKKIKYIIIDEYQDISYIRMLLVKELIKKTNANLMVVGDDFQSIYGFSGSSIDLFLDFNKYFPNSKLLKIQTTYRNSIELVSTATNFIMKNKRQIKKNMKSLKSIKEPIKLIYYKNINNSLKELLNSFKPNSKILLLGRNNNDIFSIIDDEIILKNEKLTYTKRKDLILTYMTVHKAKGLEEDNVIIINMKNDLLGFPSKIKNNSIFRVINKSDDKFPYSEERRLFYVALTRTKNYVYILVPKNNPSIFIKEISKDL